MGSTWCLFIWQNARDRCFIAKYHVFAEGKFIIQMDWDGAGEGLKRSIPIRSSNLPSTPRLEDHVSILPKSNLINMHFGTFKLGKDFGSPVTDKHLLF